jgi:hypothetical protein
VKKLGFGERTLSSDARTVALVGARELRAHGRPREAARLFKLVASLPPASGASRDDHSKHALALYESGDLSRARVAYTALAATNPKDVDVLGRLASIAIKQGDTATANNIDARLAAWNEPYSLGEPTYWRAHVAALSGRGGEAIALLHTAIAKGYRAMELNIVTIHEEPDFMSIWSDPAFRALLNRSKDPVVSP